LDVSLFDFDLPEELIAQKPLSVRSHSRLMVIHKDNEEIYHTTFPHILDYLNEGDVLVVNNTRVRHAKIIGKKQETGAKIELLLLKPLKNDWWEALVKPARRVKEGTVLLFGEGDLVGVVGEELSTNGGRSIHLTNYSDTEDMERVIERIGQAPLPPYIKEELDNSERYQTVFSTAIGSAAAPTAGLHFTPEILQQVKEKGIKVAYITLHVGLGTFRPVTVEEVEEHKMHSEYYHVTKEAASLIREAKQNHKKVVAVGTTSIRTLESIAKEHGEIRESSGWTDIFIYPGFQFQIADNCLKH
jgi:S-adenosylmethionine:tRNA ribosyltransferase-isomerase